MQNQDALLFSENEKFAVAVLADGVSECSYAKEGAEIACSTVADLFLSCADLFFSSSAKKTAYLVVSEVAKKLSNAASAKNEKTPLLFSSTLSFACLDKKKNKILIFQLGDSCVFSLSKKKELKKVHHDYEYAFTTTPEAEDFAKIKILNASSLDAIILFSDGAWKPMLSYTLPETWDDDKTLSTYFTSLNPIDDCSYIFMNTRS